MFAGADAGDAATLNETWERQKVSEKGRTSATDGVPLGQPALALSTPAVATHPALFVTFTAPSFAQLVTWSFRAIPWTIAMHAAQRYWRLAGTRASLLRAATHMNERTNPFLLPGVTVKTNATDHFPLDQAKLERYHNGHWVVFGGLFRVR